MPWKELRMRVSSAVDPERREVFVSARHCSAMPTRRRSLVARCFASRALHPGPAGDRRTISWPSRTFSTRIPLRSNHSRHT